METREYNHVERMAILVIGGHSRNIGKSALVVDLIRAFPDAEWTAIKITQYGHGVCAVSAQGCGCAPADHAVALDEETNRSGLTDTSRFLVAGAARALWLRTKQGYLAEAMPLFRDETRGAPNVIVESNSLLQFLRPDVYLVVLDPAAEDFKDSARRFLDRSDGVVLRSPLPSSMANRDARQTSGAAWTDQLRHLVEDKPCFLHPLAQPLPGKLVAWLRGRITI